MREYKMNAIDFLIKEHEKVKKMLADIADDSHREETKHKMFASLCDELIRHEVMERTVWYPHSLRAMEGRRPRRVVPDRPRFTESARRDV